MKKFSKCVGKMRMSLMTLAAVLCCAMAASVFTACSSSDDDNKDSDSSSKVGGVMVYVGFKESEDVLKYCDVGHEITHGFDNNGSHYGPKGEDFNWWTVSDKQEYDELTKQQKRFFQAYGNIWRSKFTNEYYLKPEKRTHIW